MPSFETVTLADKLLEVHAWFRAELGVIRTEARDYLANRAGGRPPGLGLQLRQRCLEFCQGLEFHHTGEDAHVFPAVAAEHPELREPIVRLIEEHRVVARLKGELAAALADIEGAEPEPFLARIDRLAEELAAHLDYEEERLLPALAEVPLPQGGPPNQ